MNSKDLQFSPDYTPSQLREMGVYGEVYGPKTAPRLASLPEWPEHWYNEADPHGWLQWYNRYSKGRRIDDDQRQIKRWLAFKARHGGKMFQENPTPRRAYALRNWAVDPLKLVNDPKKRVELEKAMEEYRAKKYKQAADMEWARQGGGIPEAAGAFDFVKDKVVPGMQQAAFNFGGKAYDAVSNFLKPKQPAAPGAVANAFKPNWAKPQDSRIGIGVPTKTFTGLSSKISNALELYKKSADRPGLWDNIRAKRARGEAPAKPGDKGYPDKKQWKRLTSKKAELIELLQKFASSPAWQRSAGKSPKGGLNATGRASYNRETGGNLKAPVTEKNPSGEREKRQNSFCARMCGHKRKNTGSATKNDPNSRVNKALRRWRCKCSEEFTEKLAEIYHSIKSAEVRFDFKRKAPIGKRMARQMRSDRLGLAFLFGAGIGGVSGLSDAALTRYQLEGQKKRSKSDKVKKEIDKELEQISLPKSTLVGAAVGAGLGGYMQGDSLRASKRAKNFGRDFGRNFRHGFNDYFKRRRYQQGSFARESSIDSTNKAKKYFNIEKVKTKDEAKKVYRDLVRQHHPDKGGEEHKMKEINNHWDHIKHSDWFKKLAFEKVAAMRRSIYSAPKHVRDAFFRDPALHKRLSQAGGRASKTKKKINVEPKKTQLNFDDKLDAVPHEEGLELFREGKSRIKRADIIKFAKSKVLLDLIKAKELSDKRDFVHKNELLRKLVTEHPKQFKIDSHLNSSYVGLTHKPTGFKIHAQKKIIPSELLTDQ